MDGFIDELNHAFLTDCLIGTAMLDPHRLELDYGSRTVRLIRNPTW